MTARSWRSARNIAGGLILLIAAIPRTWIAFHDQGIFWPDEIFQTLEAAHRSVFGYGFVAWEFQDGARSWVFPGFIGAIWAVPAALGLDSGPSLVILAKGVMVALSLVAVAASMILADELSGPVAGIIAGAFSTVFPPLLVYSGRALTDVASGPLLIVAALLSVRRTAYASSLCGAIAALSVLVRYQNGVFALGLLIVLLVSRRWGDARRYCIGALPIVVAGGVLDWVTWGAPFHSLVFYLNYTLVEGKASLYGTAPFEYYAVTAWTSTGLAVVALLTGFVLACPMAPGLCFLVVLYVMAHSVIPHKEFRFVMPVAPLFLALAATGWVVAADLVSRAVAVAGQRPSPAASRLKRNVAPDRAPAAPRARHRRFTIGATQVIALVSALVLCGAMAQAASDMTFARMGQYADSSLGERSPWHWGEDLNRALWKAGEFDDVCGVGLVGRAPVWTGGYTYLHRDVPVLTVPVRALEALSNEQIGHQVNYLILRSSLASPEGYGQVAALGEVKLLRRSGSCAPPPPNYRLLPHG